MNIAIDGDSFFTTGWLACLLGLPRQHPAEAALRTEDIHSFDDGWDMCQETGLELAFTAFHTMRHRGTISVCWRDDDGDEIDGQGKKV